MTARPHLGPGATGQPPGARVTRPVPASPGPGRPPAGKECPEYDRLPADGQPVHPGGDGTLRRSLPKTVGARGAPASEYPARFRCCPELAGRIAPHVSCGRPDAVLAGPAASRGCGRSQACRPAKGQYRLTARHARKKFRCFRRGFRYRNFRQRQPEDSAGGVSGFRRALTRMACPGQSREGEFVASADAAAGRYRRAYSEAG